MKIFSNHAKFKYQIKSINPDLLSWAVEDIDQLPDILMEDEKLIHIIDGLYDEVAVLLFSTDIRIIFKGFGVDFIEVIPHEKIVSIAYSSSQEILEINMEEKVFLLEKSNPELAHQFCTTVNTFLRRETPNDVLSDPNVSELLEQLGRLKDSRILTHEEFTEQKRKLEKL